VTELPEMSSTKPATMAQIAERAGVALSTVSYVLSGKRPVSEKMRQRVMAAIEELDYRPHGPARALASGASHTIALFMPSPQWSLLPIHQTFVAGATQATSASDYALLLSTAATDPETIAQIVACGRADGVILMETLVQDMRVARLQRDGHPFVLIGRTGENDGVSYVDMDFGAAVEVGLAHLARLGHTCVALFNFPPYLLEAGLTAALIARDRFEERAAELGIRGIHLPCSHEPHEAFEVAARLLRSEPDCTAALTTGWQFTGLLGALRAADKRVPDDFSVMSVIAAPFAEMLTPSLTGIEWPAFQAGRMAAEMLIEQLTVRDAPTRQILVPAELAVRESTGRVPRPRTSRAGGRARRPVPAA
jgi:DNA-binding LacI/PurR family transcriptional regulator